MEQYLNLLQDILDNGSIKKDRTGTGTISVFGRQLRFNLQDGFPLVTTKKMHLKAIIHELLWFIKGDTNIKYLNDNKVRIWNEWANEYGELGPIYGAQWREWEGKDGKYDQLQEAIYKIKNNPNDRRIIVSAWNVGAIHDMRLAPCHLLYQFYVANGKLSCQMYQRSADTFLGVPFNIASYALLTMMIAQVCDLEVGEFVHVLADTHIYLNHIDQVKLQLTRKPYALPIIKIKPDVNSIFDFKYDDFSLVDYTYHPKIKGEISV